jgi:hypothetical protein
MDSGCVAVADPTHPDMDVTPCGCRAGVVEFIPGHRFAFVHFVLNKTKCYFIARVSHLFLHFGDAEIPCSAEHGAV